jgi:LysR family transcriptional regulator, low CO2-responsive transcriptional regulator
VPFNGVFHGMKSIIESQQLRVYVMLARLLNMSRAAEELSMTPSGISHCLKTLERDLGCRLFERTSRKMALTHAGREFLAEAGEILDRMQSVRDKIRSWRDWRKGHMRIGASTTACQFIIPPALREFRESFPDFTVKIEACTSTQAANYLPDGRIDLALLTEPAQYPSLNFSFLAEDDLQFIVHPLHSWAIRRKTSREDIAEGKLIMPEAGSDTHNLITDYFRQEQLVIQPFIEIANEDAIKHFIQLDMGVGILPQWMVAQEIEQGMLTALPLGRRRLKRRWGIFSMKTRRFSFAEALFVNICRNVLRELVSKSAE